MPSYTFYGTAGTGLYGESTSYNNAREINTFSNSTATSGDAGQFNDAGNYTCAQSEIVFNTSTMQGDKQSASLNVNVNNGSETGLFSVEVRGAAGWVAGSQLAAKPLFGSKNLNSWPANTYTAIGCTDLAQVIAATNLTLNVSSSEQRTGTAPGLNVFRYLSFRLPAHAGTSQDPYLSVTTVTTTVVATSAALAAAASLGGLGNGIAASAAALVATGLLSALGASLVSTASNMAASASLDTDGRGLVQSSVAMASAATLASEGAVGFNSSAAMSAAGSMAAEGLLLAPASAAFVAAGAMAPVVVDATIRVASSAAMVAVASITPEGVGLAVTAATFAVSAMLAADLVGRLIASARDDEIVTWNLEGSEDVNFILTGSEEVTFTLTGSDTVTAI